MDNEQMYNYSGDGSEVKKSAKPVVSLVLGILSIIWMPGLILSIVGLVLGNQSTKNGLQPAGVAKAGKITSIVGLVLSILKVIGSTIITIIALIVGIAPFLAAIGLAGAAAKIESDPNYNIINNYDYDNYDYNNGYNDYGYDDDYGYGDDDYGYGDDYGYDDFNYGNDDNNLGVDDGGDGFYTGSDKPVYNQNGDLIGYESDLLSTEGAQIVGSINGVRFVTPEGFTYGYGDATYAVYMTDIADYEFPAYVFNGDNLIDTFDPYVNAVKGTILDEDIYPMYNSYGDMWQCRDFYFYNDFGELTICVYAVCEEEDTAVVLMARPKAGDNVSEEDFKTIISKIDELTCSMFCHCRD